MTAEVLSQRMAANTGAASIRRVDGAGDGAMSVLDSGSVCCDAVQKAYVARHGIRKNNHNHKRLFWCEVKVIAYAAH